MNLFSRLTRWMEAPAVVEMTPTPIEWPKPSAVSGSAPAAKTLLAKATQERSMQYRRPKFTPGYRVVVAMPYCAGDLVQMANLLRWMAELGRVKANAVLCCPQGLDEAEADHIEALAGEVFEHAETIRTAFDLPREGWPIGCNWSFMHLAEQCHRARVDFMLIEPDCVPLRAGWYEALVEEYRESGLPYMGTLEPEGAQHPPHVPGNAIYHWETWKQYDPETIWKAWDIAMAGYILPRAHITDLIHQDWGTKDGPPKFKSLEDLGRIPKSAVLFHRNKDGALIQLLRQVQEEPCEF